MPRIKSSIKDVRKSREQREINSQEKSKLRTVIKGARTASDESRPAMIQKAYKVIDKAVQSGLIHKNAGARYKSSLAKKKPAAKTAGTAA